MRPTGFNVLAARDVARASQHCTAAATRAVIVARRGRRVRWLAFAILSTELLGALATVKARAGAASCHIASVWDPSRSTSRMQPGGSTLSPPDDAPADAADPVESCTAPGRRPAPRILHPAGVPASAPTRALAQPTASQVGPSIEEVFS